MRKFVIIYAFFFFMAINSSFFWKQLEGWSFFAGLLYMLLFYGAVILCIGHFILMLYHKFGKRHVNINAIILLTVLLNAIYFPIGILDFERLIYGKNELVASMEGAVNCTTTIKLKANHRFYKERICFGFGKYRGDYDIKNDTIWFYYDDPLELGYRKTFGIFNETQYGTTVLNYRKIVEDTVVILPMRIIVNELDLAN